MSPVSLGPFVDIGSLVTCPNTNCKTFHIFERFPVFSSIGSSLKLLNVLTELSPFMASFIYFITEP